MRCRIAIPYRPISGAPYDATLHRDNRTHRHFAALSGRCRLLKSRFHERNVHRIVHFPSPPPLRAPTNRERKYIAAPAAMIAPATAISFVWPTTSLLLRTSATTISASGGNPISTAPALPP